jgi:hypothetical protein
MANGIRLCQNSHTGQPCPCSCQRCSAGVFYYESIYDKRFSTPKLNCHTIPSKCRQRAKRRLAGNETAELNGGSSTFSWHTR